jgi:hypothetical protein
MRKTKNWRAAIQTESFVIFLKKRKLSQCLVIRKTQIKSVMKLLPFFKPLAIKYPQANGGQGGVNPTIREKELNGIEIFNSISEVPSGLDIVNVFLNHEIF